MVRSGPTLVLVMEQVMAKQAVWGLVVYALVMVGVVGMAEPEGSAG